MSIRSFFQAHRRIRRITIGVVAAVGFYSLAGFLLVPAIARSVAQKQLTELLHRQVTIDQIRLNPYALSATVRGLRIRDRDGTRDLFSLSEVYVNIGIASIWKGGPVIQQIRVVDPAVDVVRLDEDRYNFSDILDDAAKGPPSPPPDPNAKPARFSVSNIQLEGGRIRFDDRWKGTRHEIAQLNIGVPFLSNFPYLVETFVQPAFSAVVNGTRVAIDGRTKPFADSLESSIEINLAKVDLPYYLAYVPVKLRMKLRSATLDTALKVTFIQYRDRPSKVDVGGTIALSSLDTFDDQDRPLFALPRLDIDIASSDLLANHLSLRRIALASPALHLRRDRKGELQVQHLVVEDPATPAAKTPAAKTPAAPAKTEAAAPWRIDLDELALRDARIVFTDASNAQPFATTLDPFTITVRRFSTAPGHKAQVAVSIATDAKETIALDGALVVEPFVFDGTLAIHDVNLPRFSPYYASAVLFDVKSGVLDLTVPVRAAAKGKAMDVVVTGLSTELRDLRLRRRVDRDDFLRLPLLAVRGTNFDLGRKDLVIGDIATSDARIRLERAGATAPWNVETLVPTAGTSPSAEPRPAPATQAKQEDPFTVTLQKLDLKGWSARIEDRGPRVPATTVVDRIGVRVENLGTARGKTGRVGLQARLNQTGSIDIAGSLGLDPLQANLQTKLKTIPVLPAQPYFQDSVGLLLTSGQVGLDGRVVIATAAKGPVVNYKGEVTAGDFIAATRDRAEELARLGRLRVAGIDLTTEPFKVDVSEITVEDYGANVVLRPDGTVNLAALAPPEAKSEKPAPEKHSTAAGPPAAPPSIRVGTLVLRNGTIHVEDRSTRPAFATTLANFGGRITGISLDESTRATVALEGKLGSGPLAVTGTVNPLAKTPFIDLSFVLSDLDLSAMTPYSGKYAGYAVERGQLYLDLAYRIDNRALDAKNNVKISQFTFGQSIESKDATGLPVRLAVSLLKDRHGVIQLDIPVSGSLDDPKFSIWGVVWTVVKNLLVKAATSPFALLGSLFGGGEELAWLEFQPGRSDMSPTGKAKLDTLAKALHERPGLKLEVEGHASPTLDLQALRAAALRDKVKAQKVKELVAAGTPGADATVTDAEYPTYLTRAYKAEPTIAKPKNALGMLKDIPVPEMEKLLLTAIVVGTDDLRLLARARAQSARDAILRAKPIDTERIFLIEPKSIAPEKKEKISDSRVDFRLR